MIKSLFNKKEKVIQIYVSFYFAFLVFGFFYFPNAFFYNFDNEFIMKSDQGTYHKLALNILSGKGLSLGGQPVTFQYGYSYLLSFFYYSFGISSKPVILFQVILSFLSFFLFLKILEKLRLNTFSLSIGVFLYLSNYNILKSTYLLMTETSTLFTVLLLAYLTISNVIINNNYYLLVIGLLSGIIGYLRTQLFYPILFIIILIIIYLLIQRNWKVAYKVILVFFVALMILTPHFLRLNKISGSYFQSIGTGYNFFILTEKNLMIPNFYPSPDTVFSRLGVIDLLKVNNNNLTIEEKIKIDKLALHKSLQNIQKDPEVFLLNYIKNLIFLFLVIPIEKIEVEHIIYNFFTSLSILGFILALFFNARNYLKDKVFTILCLFSFSTLFFTSLVPATPRYNLYILVIVYILLAKIIDSNNYIRTKLKINDIKK